MQVLVINPSFGRSGATLLLLAFLKASKELVPGLEFHCIAYEGGSLESSFKMVCQNRLSYVGYRVEKQTRIHKVWRRIKGKPTIARQPVVEINGAPLATFFKSNHFDLVLSNTLINGKILNDIVSHISCPVITYAHELNKFLTRYFNRPDLELTLQHTRQFIVPVKEAADNLVENYGIKPNAITIIPSLVTNLPAAQHEARETPEYLRKKHAITTKWIVGVLGNPEWIKGSDLFLAICGQMLAEANGDITCLWVGGAEGNPAFDDLIASAATSAFTSHIRIIKTVSNPADYMHLLDVLMICSREECMPLVLMEAAAAQIPVVAFEGTGGGASFIRNSGCKTLVPMEDTYAFAKMVLRLVEDNFCKKEQGFALYQHLMNTHQPEKSIRQFTEALTSFAHKTLPKVIA